MLEEKKVFAHSWATSAQQGEARCSWGKLGKTPNMMSQVPRESWGQITCRGGATDHHHQQWNRASVRACVRACMRVHMHERALVYIKITGHLWIYVQGPRIEHKDEDWGKVFPFLLVTT